MARWQPVAKKEQKLSDTIDTSYQKLFVNGTQDLKLTNLFGPFLSRMVNYANKTILSCDVEKFSRRLKITPDRTMFELVEEMYKFGFNPVLAGGKVISYVNCELSANSTNDFDIFFISGQDYTDFYNFIMTNASRLKVKKDITQEEMDKRNFRSRWKVVCSLKHVIECLYTAEDGTELKVQIITKNASCLEEILEGFDFRCCAIAYFRNKIYWVNGCLKDIKNKKLVVCTPRKSSNIFGRVVKYANKGYTIDTADLLALSILHVEFYMGISENSAYYQIEAGLDTLVRNQMFDRNREDYANLILGDQPDTFDDIAMLQQFPFENRQRVDAIQVTPELFQDFEETNLTARADFVPLIEDENIDEPF
jgi:hypothetical protein